MAILVTFMLLVGTAGILALLQVLRPQFRFSWLVAVAGATAAWLSSYLWLPGLPIHLRTLLWQATASVDSYATFVVTSTTWPYAASLTTVALAHVLTAPARPGFPSPSTWALSLGAIGLGLLGTTAEGPLTLVLFWAGLDLLEAGVDLARPEGRDRGSPWSFTFTLRLGSMALVLLGMVLGTAGDSGAAFGAIQGAGLVLLPAAALLRLVALAATGDAVADRDAVRLVLHLSGSAAAIGFLSQLTPAAGSGLLLLGIVCAAVSLYAGWMWLRGPDATTARAFWTVGMGSLAVAAVLGANPLGATAIGNAMILAGSALLLVTAWDPWPNRIVPLGIALGSGLPLTLTATLWRSGLGMAALLPAFLIAQGMLLAGFFHLARSLQGATPRPEKASPLRGFYRLGILLPILVGLGLGLWGWPGALQAGLPVAAGVVMLAASAFVWAKRRFSVLSPSALHWTPKAAGAVQVALVRELARVRDMLRRAETTMTGTLEGEAGILWSLVVLVLFVSLIAGRTP